jgi:cytoskeletal protein CcmA (bactofilin family)
MFSNRQSLCLVFFLLVALCASAAGYEWRSGDDIYLSEDFRDDLMLFGDDVRYDGTVRGDLLAAGNTVTFAGNLDGNLWTFAKRVTVDGKVRRSVRGAAQYVTVNAVVDGDVTLAAQEIVISADALIMRDCALAASEVIVDGQIEGNGDFAGGFVTVSGRVDGDLHINGSEISITPQAVVEGDLTYESQKRATIAADAQILGETRWKKIRERSSSGLDLPGAPPPGGFVWSFLFLCGNLLIGIIVIFFKRDMVERIINDMKSNVLLHGLVGALMIVMVPILLLLLTATVIGLPVAIVGFSMHTALFFVSKIVVGIALGGLVLSLLSGSGRVSMGWSLLLGMIALALLFKIPVLGWLFYFAAWAIGLGAITFCFFRRKRVIIATEEQSVSGDSHAPS